MRPRLALACAWLWGTLGCSVPDVVGDEGAVVTSCEIPPMDAIYSDPLAPNPSFEQPRAGACIDQRHDALIVLGCPSNDDGTASPCQIERADIAVALEAAGYGDHYIVSGAAAHNDFVEAEALRDLLLARGVAPDAIELEPLAEHTDENLYYSSQIMLTRGLRSALVISDGAGQLLYNALCDSNCCVELGRLTVVELAGFVVGHYVLYPDAEPVTEEECAHIEDARMGICLFLGQRRACKDHFEL